MIEVREVTFEVPGRKVPVLDAVSFAVMEAARCRHVLGFDQDFAAAGFSLWQGSERG